MGNIKSVGGGGQYKPVSDQVQKEVKGSANSSETRASTERTSNAVTEQNATAFRNLLIQQFGDERGKDMANALEGLKKEGKFLTFEAVKEVMQGVLEKNKELPKEKKKGLEAAIDEICNTFPHKSGETKILQRDYDPYAFMATILGMQKEKRKANEKSAISVEEFDRESNLVKRKEIKEKQEDLKEISQGKPKKQLRDPKKRV